MTSGFAFLWAVFFALLLLAEGYALGSHNGATLSAVVRGQLQHPVGRFVFYPLWAWLTWHWFLAPAIRPTWRDAVAVAIGLLVAWFATRGR